jgi:pyroglutamyl-peptidase
MQGPRVLITGFGPFPGVPENPSGWLAEALAERWLSAEPERPIHARILPTEWEAAALMPRLCETLQPDVMIHFGVCEQARTFRIERSAHNRVAARVDACGTLPASPVIFAGGAARLDTPFPAGALARHLKANGVAAVTSHCAGQYLCNYLYYHALDWAGRQAGSRHVLFVHIPPLSAAGDGLSREHLLDGAEHILRFVLALTSNQDQAKSFAGAAHAQAEAVLNAKDA